LRQFFPYFGSKHRNAHRYPAPIGRRVIEPFAGAAGYAHLHHDHDVVLLDTYAPVIAAWQFLISATPADVLALPLLGPDDRVADLDVPDGARALIGFWCLRASTTPRDKLSSWTERWPTRFWGAATRERVAGQVDAIKHWRAYQMPFEVAGWVADEDTTVFADPPYVGAGKLYPHHEIDYPRLADWCRALPGRVIVCEQAPASWLPFVPAYEHVGIRRETRSEVVWTR
jgi:hypothetical protein